MVDKRHPEIIWHHRERKKVPRCYTNHESALIRIYGGFSRVQGTEMGEDYYGDCHLRYPITVCLLRNCLY